MFFLGWAESVAYTLIDLLGSLLAKVWRPDRGKKKQDSDGETGIVPEWQEFENEDLL